MVAFVVGSGPAGAAAAAALAERGQPVVMLDAGGELEPDVRQRMARLGEHPPESWSAADHAAVRGPLRFNSEGAPLKLLFGSDFPYRDVERHEPLYAREVDAYRSFALGGLSRLWGASVLPYGDEDLDGWPLGSADLAPHYAAALGLTGLSAARDDLEVLFPLHVEPTADLPASGQAQALLGRLRKHARALRGQGIWFGKARLAVKGPQAPADGCRLCGLCLYGCAYDQIYAANTTVTDLTARAPGFRYLPGQVVRRLVEKDGRVEIHTVSREGGENAVFQASRVLLAAGVFSSTRILLESLGAYGRPVTIRQSEHFLTPMLLTASAPRAAQERQHTLSQVFLELTDRKRSPHKVHLQVYGYNDFYGRMAKAKLGGLYGLLRPMLERVFERLVLVKGYLHSDDSAAIEATLERGQRGPHLELTARPNPAAAALVRSVSRTLGRNASRIGAVPLGFGTRIGPPGSGVHVGGSFPMRAEPGALETDLMGRPTGFERVHCVDSSVFPTVPAPTVTLTIMANAHRIATACAEADAFDGLRAEPAEPTPSVEELIARAREITRAPAGASTNQLDDAS
ncbi:GMC oxidoreductase [Caulobacter sp. 17J65-9]|uniref:GMC oxidoreductase n=1 Tax=Caulobacter sp. 17J65-9 TaxID=2709382 RepID=UPI0013C543E4|nr:GMC oxidoreductase [Caulobacter sp. 17J65-9]NEX92227.1 GMC family oxidoreductase [Caulobacter sp. 17J65-9]